MSVIQDQILDARLSLQRALLGEVPASLRAVVFSIVGNKLDVRFYYDGPINDVDAESASCVEAEVLADYTADDIVGIHLVRLDSPSFIKDDGTWVYQRREDS